MATSTFNARVRMKRDTSANWTTNNPVLLDGEIIVVDTASGDVRFKVGDGTSRYTALPFLDEGWDIPAPSSTTPNMDGTADIGTSTTYARADHVHPSDMFVATYGTTTTAELDAAYQAGKKIYVNSGGIFLPLRIKALGRYGFSETHRNLLGLSTTGYIVIHNIWCISDTWSSENVYLTPYEQVVQLFNNQVNYSEGDYVLQNNVIYRFISDHAAGAWTGNDAVEVPHLADEISEISSSSNVVFDFYYDNTTETVTTTATVADIDAAGANAVARVISSDDFGELYLPYLGGGYFGGIATSNNITLWFSEGDSWIFTRSNLSPTNSDWNEDDSTDPSYVENRPNIRKGGLSSSIVEGTIADGNGAATYTLSVSGSANATTFSYTTQDTLPTDSTLKYSCWAYYANGYLMVNRYHRIRAIDTTAHTIELSGPLSTSNVTNGVLVINYRKANQANGVSSHAEGNSTIASSTYAHAEGSGTIASGSDSHAEGSNTVASGSDSHTEGSSTTASGSDSHAEGYSTIASGMYSHAEGSSTTASDSSSHAEGHNTTASGSSSHAEGYDTTASGNNSHAEGSSTTASGIRSHAEGSSTTASGGSSHAEGYQTQATNYYSHAEGQGTLAQGNSSHAEGKYNIGDTSSVYAHIVGNGTSDNARSNAYTLDWSGNGVYAGKVTVGAAPTANMDVATKQYVDENAGGDTILRTWVAGTEVSS